MVGEEKRKVTNNHLLVTFFFVFVCGRRCERKVVRRLHASFSGSPEVGNGLDGELAQLVPQAGLTSAQTDAVIPPGTTVSSRSRSLKAEFRLRTTFHSCTPTTSNSCILSIYLCTLAQCTKIRHSDGDLLHAAQGKPFLELFCTEECTDYCASGTL